MQFAGRLVDNAQLRKTESGHQVTGFTVALNENYKAKDGSKVQKTTYIDCNYWNRPNITPYLTKGLLVEITGFPSARAYTTKQGEARGAIDFRVDRLDFLGGPSQNGVNRNSTAPVSEQPKGSVVPSLDTIGSGGSDGDLPF